jgi:glycine/D-amino acid oxidase-like deaminating enzyme
LPQVSAPKHSFYWWETEPVVPGPPLDGPTRCDVCIVGGGYTGLWAAHFLKQAEPSLDVQIVEAQWAGAGASGHNDGYAMTVLDMSLHHLVEHHGVERAGAAHDAVGRSVVEMGEFCREHDVDAEFEPNGFLALATNAGQLWRLQRDWGAAQRIGAGHHFEPLDAEAARRLVDSPLVQGGLKEGRGAILNPHKLVRGLARVVRGQGVTIHERTPALSVEGGRSARVVTPEGEVMADEVIVATNAYQHGFRQFKNRVIPMWSYTLVSEPLTEEQLGRVAWPGREGFEDKRNYITIGRLTKETVSSGPGGAHRTSSATGWTFATFETIVSTTSFGSRSRSSSRPGAMSGSRTLLEAASRSPRRSSPTSAAATTGSSMATATTGTEWRRVTPGARCFVISLWGATASTRACSS